MQATLKEFREIVRRVLSEAVCPGCNHPGAYIGGMNNVECPNQQCRFFSQKQLMNHEIERDAWDCPQCDRKNIPTKDWSCPDCGHDPHKDNPCAGCGSQTANPNDEFCELCEPDDGSGAFECPQCKHQGYDPNEPCPECGFH